jgi:hypothetical protein
VRLRRGGSGRDQAVGGLNRFPSAALLLRRLRQRKAEAAERRTRRMELNRVLADPKVDEETKRRVKGEFHDPQQCGGGGGGGRRWPCPCAPGFARAAQRPECVRHTIVRQHAISSPLSHHRASDAEEFEARERDLLRESRKRITPADFDSLVIIGRGAFGEVRPLVRLPCAETARTASTSAHRVPICAPLLRPPCLCGVPR